MRYKGIYKNIYKIQKLEEKNEKLLVKIKTCKKAKQERIKVDVMESLFKQTKVIFLKKKKRKNVKFNFIKFYRYNKTNINKNKGNITYFVILILENLTYSQILCIPL